MDDAQHLISRTATESWCFVYCVALRFAIVARQANPDPDCDRDRDPGPDPDRDPGPDPDPDPARRAIQRPQEDKAKEDKAKEGVI